MRTRENYQRVICACCFLAIFLNIGLPSTSFSVYQPFLADLVGDGSASLIVATRTGVSLLCMLLVGIWYKRLDCRLGIFLAAMLTGIGFVIYTLASTLPFLCIASAITGAGYGLGGMVGMTLLISRWYRDRVGTAVGIATMGSGLAAVAMPLIVTFIIHNVSLQAAFMTEAALAFGGGVLLFALLRNYPDDAQDNTFQKDIKSAPKPDAAEAEGAKQAAPKHLLTLRQRIAMLAGTMLVGAISVVCQNYVSILMTSSGFDAYFAATVLTANGFCLMAAKGVNGVVFDKVGTVKGSAIFFGLVIVGVAMCCLAGLGNPVVMAAGAMIMGAGLSLGTVGISVWSIHLSTPEDRPALVKNMQVFYALGSFLFNLFPGAIMERTGTYVTVYLISLVFALVCATLIISVCRKAVPAGK